MGQERVTVSCMCLIWFTALVNDLIAIQIKNIYMRTCTVMSESLPLTWEHLMDMSSSAHLCSYFTHLTVSDKPSTEVTHDLRIESTSLLHYAACVSDVALSGQLEGRA